MRIITGSNDAKMREEVLKLEPPVTKDDILKIVHSIEATRNVEKSITKSTDVNKLSDYTKSKKAAKLMCKSCGYLKGSDCKGPINCPASGKDCRKCGKQNHFASVCPNKSSKTNSIEIESDSGSADDYDQEN